MSRKRLTTLLASRFQAQGTLSRIVCPGLGLSFDENEAPASPRMVDISSSLNSGRRWPQSAQLYRGFASSTTTPPPPSDSVDAAHSILQRLDTAHFREVLEQERETRWNMEHSELVQLCLDSGAAKSKEDATEICEALDRSGVVLRVKNLVYLRPLEVAEIIYQALPDTDKEVRARLEQLKTELNPLQAQKEVIDNHAHRISKTVLWGGLVVMVGQWTLFARLTFWELSWDVMEPVTYFTGAAVGIAAYAYCLWYDEEFGYSRARERIHTSVADRTYEREGFDKARFDYLLRRIHRLESSLSASRSLAGKSQQ